MIKSLRQVIDLAKLSMVLQFRQSSIMSRRKLGGKRELEIPTSFSVKDTEVISSPEYLELWKAARETLDLLERGQADLDGASERLATMKADSTMRRQPKRFDRDALDSF